MNKESVQMEKLGIGSISPDETLKHINEIIQPTIAQAQKAENNFPTEVFPPIFKNLINEAQKSLNYSPDYTGTAILLAVASAIGTSAKIKVKNHWFEFPSFYAGIIGNAGANKSHPLSLIFDVFNEMDGKIIAEHKIKYEEFEIYDKLKANEKAEAEVKEKPVLIKTILHNFTSEILHQRLSDNLRGCIVVTDELTTFLKGMNNYSKGDQTSMYLSFWSSKPTSIDRVSKPIPLFIQQPYLSIIGSLQPRVLTKVFPSENSDNGFLQRFLFAFPSNLEKIPINDIEIDEQIILRYKEFIINYLKLNPTKFDLENGKPEAKIYCWHSEAKDFFYHWQKLNTIEVNDNPDSLKGEIITKFDIHFVRIALVLQIMEDSNSDKISLNAVMGASKLCGYFLYNAIKVLNILESASKLKDSLPKNKMEFMEKLPNEFTTGQGIQIGSKFGIKSRTVKSFLKKKLFFERSKYGNYKKRG